MIQIFFFADELSFGIGWRSESVNQTIKLFDGLHQGFLFVLQNILLATGFVLPHLVQVLNRQIFEIFIYGELAYGFVNLGIKVFQINSFFGTIFVLAFSATIIHVMMRVAVLLVFDFFLGGNHRSAISASHQTSESEAVLLRTRSAFSAEQFLDDVKIFFGNHRLVIAFVELFRSAVFKVAVIKRIGENAIDCASAKRFAVWILFRGT